MYLLKNLLQENISLLGKDKMRSVKETRRQLVCKMQKIMQYKKGTGTGS